MDVSLAANSCFSQLFGRGAGRVFCRQSETTSNRRHTRKNRVTLIRSHHFTTASAAAATAATATAAVVATAAVASAMAATAAAAAAAI